MEQEAKELVGELEGSEDDVVGFEKTREIAKIKKIPL
jgi:hypothetical protein